MFKFSLRLFHAFLLAAIALSITVSPTIAQQGRDTGYGFCPLHKISYKGANCPSCVAGGGTTSGSSGVSPQNQILLGAAGLLGAALGEMLRGDPEKAARLEAEARERALALQLEQQRKAAETERKRQEVFTRLRGSLKLDNFDGDSGGWRLKGVDVGSGGGLALKLGDPGSDLSLKLGESGSNLALKVSDDELKPLGTRAFVNSGDANSPAPNTDPMVVDLRDLKQSAFLIRSFETAAPEDAPFLLNEALKVANGDKSFMGGVPAGITMPAIDEKGLLAFQKANSDYRNANDFEMKCTETFKLAQQRRELADWMAKAARADMEETKTKLINEATLQNKHQLMANIFAVVKAEDEAWTKAKAEVEAARTLNYQAREEAMRVLRATAAGKDPATFHPPIASLPGLDEKTWMQVQEKMIASRHELDRQNSDIRKQVKDLNVPIPITYERYHEGVILGAGTDAGDAHSMITTISPFSGKTPLEMNEAAEKAKKSGIEGVGGAMVVSFGTPKDGTPGRGAVEVTRVLGDHVTTGQVSLNTPEGKQAVAALSGKEFDRLIAHSNGASITEALIQEDLIKVNELNIVGGDRSLLNGHAFQKLLDSGKVKRVVVWINVNDPIVSTALDQLKLAERRNDALEHIGRKITGELAGGDSRVKYHFMVGQGKGIFGPHYLETAYYPNIASELGTPWAFSRSNLEK